MQCPRCFFDNPADARWCGYCGHAFEEEPTSNDSARPGPDPGRAARKRETRLGLSPVDDPFKAAAMGLRGGSAAAPVAEPASPAPSVPAPAPPPVPRRPARHATIVEGVEQPRERTVEGEIVGLLLVLVEGAAPSPRLLREGRLRLGRDTANDLSIDDPRVSAHHAVLQAQPGGAWLLDVSTNGTVVNGVRVHADRAPLADGAVIELGRTAIVVQIFAEDTLGMLRGLTP